jgi:hypothetical protein
MTSATQIKIEMALAGAAQVRNELKATAAEVRSVNAAGNNGGSRGALATFRRDQRIQNQLLSVAGLGGGPAAQMADRFEYLNFMAGNMNMSVGSMLAKFGPMAVAVALVGKAWNTAQEEVSKINSQLDSMGMKQVGFVDWLKLGVLGDTSVVQVDPTAMYQRTMREATRDFNVQLQFEEAIAKQTDLSKAARVDLLHTIEAQVARVRELKSLEEEFYRLTRQQPAEDISTVAALDARMQRLPDLIANARGTAMMVGLPPSIRDDAGERSVRMQIELEQLRLRRPGMVRQEEEKAAAAAKQDLAERAQIAKRWQQEQDAAFREQVAERLTPMQSALGQWQNAAGQPRFAGADAAGSVEAYRATIAAGSDQKGIIERQLAEQVKMVRLLEDIVRGRSTANIALVSLEGM